MTFNEIDIEFTSTRRRRPCVLAAFAVILIALLWAGAALAGGSGSPLVASDPAPPAKPPTSSDARDARIQQLEGQARELTEVAKALRAQRDMANDQVAQLEAELQMGTHTPAPAPDPTKPKPKR